MSHTASVRTRAHCVAVVLAAAAAAAPVSITEVSAQAPSDLFLVHVRAAGRSLAVDSVSRLTDRAGYDNQPSFVPDGSAILYTAIDGAGQADIFRVDLASRMLSQVTRTSPESEYSATPMPGRARFSAIRVEPDSAQRLWSFTMRGDDPEVLLEDLRPVGYHAWIDADRLALFVLGTPATLRLADIRDGSVREIARDIGRSIHRVPGGMTVSFVHRDGAGDTGWIKILDPGTLTVTPLIQPFAENEYHAWTPDGLLLTARGSVLYGHRPGEDDEWVAIADLSEAGVAGISRLAVSPDGRSVAVVAAH